MSSDLPPPPPPPLPPRPPAIPPPPSPSPSAPPPPPPPRGSTPSSSTGDTVPPLSFSLAPFTPPPPPAAAPSSPLTTATPPPPPAPTSSIPPPPPRRSQLPPKTRRALTVGTVALVLLIAAGLTWSYLRKRVPASELAAWLHEQSSAALTIGDLAHTVTPQKDGSNLIKFDARGTVPSPLYVRENTASHLRRTLDLSPASPSAVRAAAESAADARIRERAGVSDTPVDLLETIVLRETTAAGIAFPLSGLATASRVNGQWKFSLLEGSLPSPALEGQPRATFGEKTYIAGNPADDAALKQLVEKQTDVIARLEKAASAHAEENKRDRDSRLARFHDVFSAGTLFTGHATPASGGHAEPISLEIITAKPGARQLTALLRNAGGWTDARPFLGTWKLDEATGIFSLSLNSRSNQAIADAGPILATREAVSFVLLLGDDNSLTTTDSDFPLEFSRIAPDKLSATKASLTTRLDAALDATRANTIYHGTATAKETGATEHLFLRFTKQTDQGAALTAAFESAEAGASYKRPIRGAIIDSLPRMGEQLIRLQMPGSGRARSARPGTLFAQTSDTAPALKIEGTRLLGEDAAFKYEFARITAEQALVLKNAAEAASAAVIARHPRASGVHAQIDGQWTALPRNGGSTSGGIGGFAKGLFSKNKDADKPAVLVFKGNTPPPAVSGEDLTLTFKGKIPSRAKGVPADYPLIEAARTTAQEDGTRTVPLERISTGFTGFGASRLTATIAQPAGDILTLSFEQTLAPGTYAILVGTDGYEFTVK